MALDLGTCDHLHSTTRAGDAQTARVFSSALYLMEHLHEVPVHVIPCLVPDSILTQQGRVGACRPARLRSAPRPRCALRGALENSRSGFSGQ